VIDINYYSSVKNIVQRICLERQNGIKKPQETLEKIRIDKVDSWIIKKAKESGLSIDGYEHEISYYFIRHVLEKHGDEKKESSRGNLAITSGDLEQIPIIIKKPDYVIFGAKRYKQDRIIYVKMLENGTLLYFEEILCGKTNKSLRGNTMYKTKKTLGIDGVIANIGMNRKTDLSKIKITGMDGGQTINTANQD
jgi:hypothetical protein